MAGDKGANGEEIDLKQVPEGWRWVIVQAVRWWRCCALWSFFFFPLEISLFFFLWLYMWYFCLFAISFPAGYEEMFLILRGPVPVLSGLWISSCSAFLVEFTVPSFLLPSTSLLFYHSTDTVFLLDSVSFCLLCPTVTSLGREFIPDLLWVFLSQYCELSKLLLELGWVVDF